MAVIRRSRAAPLLALVVTLFLLFGLEYSVPGPPSSYRSSPKLKPRLHFTPSGFNWSAAEQYYPVESLTPLPKGRRTQLPKVQHDFGKHAQRNDAVTEKRRLAVMDAFVRSWESYKQFAWLQDELTPVSAESKNPFGGWAATMVDALDTLWMMGLKEDFFKAAQAVVDIDFSKTEETGINLFETTIRHLGGLLSAYDLSGEPALLAKAVDLGDMLYMAFDTPNRMPGFWLTFENAKNGIQKAGTYDPSAAPTSMSLEFTRLAQLTGDDKYYDAIDRIRAFLERTQEDSLLPGMWPSQINFRSQSVRNGNTFTIGALADSLYEYLPKMFVLLGGRAGAKPYEKMYRRAMEIVSERLLFKPMLKRKPTEPPLLFAGTVYVHDEAGPHLIGEGQHLSCFAGGMFLLGGKVFGIQEHLEIGEGLARGCGWAYAAFPTGVMPEIFNLVQCGPHDDECEWNETRWRDEGGGDSRLPSGFINARDPRYILRPEAIESIFILYRVTGNEELRDIAWDMFQGIMKSTKTEHAYSAIADVTVEGETRKDDSMESFWLAETLKYFYLIFSPPDVISLDDYVLNTEAHPFKRA
ncbi:glycoside hydrolase family 47 [Apiospora phragmitis]|uniref:alpha-1,2-Mannosidase n=1 Tax=Apiospora phragmitis TaxID=2905665 RepID=A0ABR1USN1_9PEZI